MINTENGICSRILTPKQVGPICWFMAAFVAMFYSQRSRKKLIEASKSWNKKKEIFTLLKQVLDDKYLKTESRESKDYEKFSDDTFGKILTLLYKENKYVFPYNPKVIVGGFHSEIYMGKLYKLLNVDYRMYDYCKSNNNLYYSYLNEEFDSMEYKISKKNIQMYVNNNTIFKYSDIDANIRPPEILMVVVREEEVFKGFFPYTIIKEGDTKANLTSMNETIFYKGVEYNLDSTVLANWNINKKNGHAIAGITCKKNKYVYNGWTRTSMDPVMAKIAITRNIPCELMKYDWNIRFNNDFCLNTTICIPDIMKRVNKLKKSDVCFNFSKGKRILVYVRKEVAVNTSIEKDDVIQSKNIPNPIPKIPIKIPINKKDCPEGKVRNPATGRCILIKNAKAAKAAKAAKGKTNIPYHNVVPSPVIKPIPVVPSPVVPSPVVKPIPVVIDKNTADIGMELSVFIYISKDFNFRMTQYYNEIVFVKFGKKVYIEITEGDEMNAPATENGMMDIIMPFDELMKNKYLKKYYELSLMAIGKPNIDANYYNNDMNILKNHYLIDAIYIVEDAFTKIKVAKKGNIYRHFNLSKLKKMKVDADSIEEFNTAYNEKFGVDEETFDELSANYTALINKL